MKLGLIAGYSGKKISIPMDVIIGKDGVVQAVHVGASPDLIDNMKRELDTLVAGKSLVAPEKPKQETKAEEKKK